MARITILDFEISDRAESKFWMHGIARDQIYEMLQNRLTIVANRKNRAARVIAIGRDNSGRCIAVPVWPSEDPTVWQPVTAWYCKPSETAKLR